MGTYKAEFECALLSVYVSKHFAFVVIEMKPWWLDLQKLLVVSPAYSSACQEHLNSATPELLPIPIPLLLKHISPHGFAWICKWLIHTPLPTLCQTELKQSCHCHQAAHTATIKQRDGHKIRAKNVKHGQGLFIRAKRLSNKEEEQNWQFWR